MLKVAPKVSFSVETSTICQESPSVVPAPERSKTKSPSRVTEPLPAILLFTPFAPITNLSEALSASTRLPPLMVVLPV